MANGNDATHDCQCYTCNLKTTCTSATCLTCPLEERLMRDLPPWFYAIPPAYPAWQLFHSVGVSRLTNSAGVPRLAFQFRWRLPPSLYSCRHTEPNFATSRNRQASMFASFSVKPSFQPKICFTMFQPGLELLSRH